VTRTLTHWQEGGAQFVSRESPKSRRGRRCLLMEMRTGKTPTSARAAALLQCRRILVLCPESGINVWRYDGAAWLEQFTGLKCHIHLMNEEAWNREREWNKPTLKDELHLYICVYNTFAKDMGVRPTRKRNKGSISSGQVKPLRKIIGRKVVFDVLICDEAKRINNRTSAAFQAVSNLFRDHHCPYFIPMTGTPGDDGPESYWAYFRLIDPKKFSSYWQYIEYFMVVDDGPFGKEILEQRNDTKAEWDRLVNEYCWVVPEGSVMPPVKRKLEVYDMDPDQEKLYNDMQEEMMSISDDHLVLASNSMVQWLRLRQILICPKILGANFGVGGAIKHVVSLIKDHPKDRHTVIFTPFTDAFEPFTTYLNSQGFPDVFHLHGGISANTQATRIKAFQDTKGIIICSVAYAEAFSLAPARQSWFIGSHESPDVNRQAEKRLSLLTDGEDTFANYLTANTPNDIRMREILNIKQERINFAHPKELVAFMTNKEPAP
jgi:SNF2 family DNA or RNA helicase